MSASRIVKFSLCATALLIFSAAGFAQNYYQDYPDFQAGNARSEALQVTTCGAFAYKVAEPVLGTGSYPTQSDFQNDLVFSLYGTQVTPDVVGKITFTLRESGGIQYVDWSISSPYAVCAVIVKGGPGARVYYYPAGAGSDSGLTAPINSNNGKPFDVSHVTFVFYRTDMPPECWKDETAWAAGSRYVSRGNWATYTQYVSGSTVILYAGQTMNAGTVQFSAVSGGTVTITITLASGWRFAPVDENVKIQDYSSPPPSENPIPGKFTSKGTADSGSNTFSIVVPANNYYGVHVDVERRVACPMPM